MLQWIRPSVGWGLPAPASFIREDSRQSFTFNAAVVQIQRGNLGSSQEQLWSKARNDVTVKEDRGRIHGNLSGNLGQISISALYDVHVPGLKLGNIYCRGAR